MSDLRPLPLPDADTATFWAGLGEGRLLYQACTACGHAQLYPRVLCRRCWSRDVEHRESAGKATVYSFTELHRSAAGLGDELPFLLAIVELDEGPRLVTRLVDPPGSVAIGGRVAARFVEVAPGATLVYFGKAAP